MFDGLWSTISKLPPEQLRAIEADLRYTEARDKLSAYAPYPKQREFHAAGAKHSERLFMAGNQVGKTLSGSAETAMHLTGLYPEADKLRYPPLLPNGQPHPLEGQLVWPDGWQGRRWERPITSWVAGETQETTRDKPQRELVGPPGQQDLWGTGWIPERCFAKKPSMQGGTADAIDTVLVKHISGGLSELSFKSYGRGREKWQAASLDLIWFDEQPNIQVYLEGLTRTNATNGAVMTTFTPLLGVDEVVALFLDEGIE
jgi:phage terminase large subunit-like protein